ncbi:MAG: hypothetical protein JSW00_04260 [Thermoplasmata archaeon]|nr:MAG: hypothetical protein JSW00_04260 [Thermoplasmata archaeon]
MTEVWDEKEKSSENIEEKALNKLDAQKDGTSEEMDMDNRTCRFCGRIFKNERARKTHEHHCKRKMEKEEIEDEKDPKEEQIEEIEGISDVSKLREELMLDLQRLKEERKRLEEERSAFKTEIKSELEKLKEDKKEFEMKRSDERDKTTVLDEDLKDRGQAGVTVLEADEEVKEEYAIEDMEEELESIEPTIAEMGEGISTVDLEELTMQLESIESELTTKVDFEAMTKMSEDYGKSIDALEESIASLNRKIDNVIRDLEERSRRFGTFQSISREMEKLDERTEEILEEIGFGESLNVAKIPPNILENVYESTIEGAVNEIRRNYGTHDAEDIIRRALEDVRTRTSGSELFYFDGRALKTRKLAQAIQAKLISAKQVQTTYDELLRKLLEYIPGYKAKNFRAMIKLKSQEYSVDKTTLLIESLNNIKDDLDNLNTMFGTVSNRQNSIEIEINSLIGSKIGKEEFESLQATIEEIKKKQDDLADMLKDQYESQKTEKETLVKELAALSNRVNELENISSVGKKKGAASRPKKEKKKKEDELEKKETKMKIGGVTVLDDEGELTETTKMEEEQEEPDSTIEIVEVELDENEARIFEHIPDKGYTLSRIKKEILPEVTEDEVKKVLSAMIDKDIMSTIKHGRHIIYVKKIEK